MKKVNAEDYENAKERHEHRLCEEIKASLINGIDYVPHVKIDFENRISLDKCVNIFAWYDGEPILQAMLTNLINGVISPIEFRNNIAQHIAEFITNEIIEIMEDEQL
jgi:hypothetical protein